ncbi:MAG TPA: RsmE family RNA methyltransferase, partial [Candidatus Binatia bacterium]|nr:RsmE family RNA methyltransferase [Candidatus Binatia bacterium]
MGDVAPEPKVDGMARFFVPRNNIEDHHGVITGAELDHARKVLRLRPGDHVTLFDDAGWEHEAVVKSYGAGRGTFEILKSYRPNRESSLAITLAVGVTKGEKMDLVIEKATELGAHSIVPFISSYAVPRLDASKTEKRRERWQRVALSAAKQCGRTHVSKIFPISDFQALIRQSWPLPLKLLFWEKESKHGLKQLWERHPSVGSV